MPILSNPTLSIDLDPRTPTARWSRGSDIARQLVADVTVGCDVDFSQFASWDGYTWASLYVELLGVDGADSEVLTPVQWVEIDGNGQPAIRSSQSYFPGVDVTRRFDRTCQISQAVLDEDPARPIFTSYGLYWIREGDEIEARFTLRGAVYTSPRWYPYRLRDIETATTTVTI